MVLFRSGLPGVLVLPFWTPYDDVIVAVDGLRFRAAPSAASAGPLLLAVRMLPLLRCLCSVRRLAVLSLKPVWTGKASTVMTDRLWVDCDDDSVLPGCGRRGASGESALLPARLLVMPWVGGRVACERE